MEAQDFASAQTALTQALKAMITSSTAIGAEDVGFQRAANPTADTELNDLETSIREMTEDVLEHISPDDKKKRPSFEQDYLETQWDTIVDSIDSLLERADRAFDEYSGLIKHKEAPSYENTASVVKDNKKPAFLERHLRLANIPKPQKNFEKQVNNFDKGPWKPILVDKPHAQYSLKESVVKEEDKDGNAYYTHPYQNEIISMRYPKKMFHASPPISPLPIDTTSPVWVDTYEGVEQMLGELRAAKVIAVDLEHHDSRTYIGLLSLMQISTRDKDWIVDTLQPWRHKLAILNEVFADPGIVKVLHGAQSDIIWLQRDLGLYVVGLFDTYFACQALNHESKGLAGLLKRYINFDADKKYQQADWRIRPLPEEMLYYARSDTHYLLFIFDMVRNELAEAKQYGVLADMTKDMSWVLAESKKVALQRHAGTPYDAQTGHGPGGWFNTLSRAHVILDGEQFAIYRAVHEWRDNLARKEDESTGYVLNQRQLMQIAKVKPKDRKALLGLLEDKYLARAALEELFGIITDAKSKGANEPSFTEYMRNCYSEPADQGVARYVPALRGESVDVNLIAPISQLWGKLDLSGKREQKQIPKKFREIPLPYSQAMLDAATQTQPAISMAERPKSQDSASPQLKPEISSDDEEFTLKKGKGRRIHEAVSGEVVDEMDVDSSSAEDNADILAKAAKRLAKKERREAKRSKKEAKKLAKAKKAKEAAAHPEDEENGDQDEEVFDYANADSILHGKRAEGTATSSSGKKFDPYAIGEGPKAARRMHHEKTGKTATFKK